MSGQPLVSVVVPVYNVERYVEQCVESLIGQTLDDIEIILVNDGSTDGSLGLLLEVAARDPRVRVIDKPNGGYGAAVNRGLDEARGAYVAIVEPDDFIDAHMFEDLYDAARCSDGVWADVVKGSYWNYYDHPGSVPHVAAPNLMNLMPKESFCSTVRERFEVLFHHPSIWSALYRREFLVERGIRMIEPRGAGWADNPWFFETLLQAERFVWVPAAYYYYRQTNPNASSKRLDAHTPFDRLRDVRALLERLGTTDPQILACLYSRTFSYINTLIGRFGYDEDDPGFRSLVMEALESMDQSILYGGYRGIRPEHLDYYELMTGRLSARVADREASLEPRASVVVPIGDDRGLLTGTLLALARQDLDALEVLCADVSTTGHARRVVGAFAEKDKRFRLISSGGPSRAAAIRTGASEVTAPATLFVLPGERPCVDHVRRLCDALSGGAEMALCGAPADAVRGAAASSDADAVPGMRAEVAATQGFSLGCCAFATKFLGESGALAAMGARDGALSLALGALCRARKVAAAPSPAPSVISSHRAYGARRVSDRERYRRGARALDEAVAAARGLGHEAERAARCLAVRLLCDDLVRFQGSDEGECIFQDVRERAETGFGIWDAPRTSFCNQGDLLALELALRSTYEDALRRGVGRLRERSGVLSDKLSVVRSSKSYRLGRAIIGVTKKMVPRSIVRRLRG